MKKFGSLVFVSLLSGALTLGAYKFFLEPNKAGKLTLASPNYAKNVNLGAENIDFTTAAENTIHAVVHVKNVSVSKVPGNIYDFIYGHQGLREQIYQTTEFSRLFKPMLLLILGTVVVLW
jgi:hypothetical protein